MRRLLLPLLLLAACQPEPATTTPEETVKPQRNATLAFVDVRVFDGEQWIDRATVLVDRETIVAVGPDLPVPEDITTVPGEGSTLLPGLMDAHTHVVLPDQLHRAAVFGVTTEIDMFTTTQVAEAMRKPAEPGTRADLISAGTLATAPGGHGTEYGFPIPTLTKPEQADAFVQARKDEGSDFLKIVYDDLGGRIPTVDEATLRALINAAHERDMLAVVHISAQSQAITAIEAGADGLAHLFLDEPPSSAFVSAAKEHDVFVTGTLSVLHSICDGTRGKTVADDPDLGPLLLPAERQMLSQSFGGAADAPCDHALAAAGQLHDAGVRVLTSTDAPNPGTTHGASVHDEMALLVEAGLSPSAALRSATADIADTFGLDDRGRIAPGKRADLLLVSGNPQQEIRNTRKIRGVWKSGAAVDLDSARKKADEAREKIAAAKRAPPPAGLAAGLISDFESGATTSEFGAGWMNSTDAMIGGKSEVEVDVVNGAMRLRGTIAEGSVTAWAGAMFFPGDRPMAPANLMDKPILTFEARGQGPMRVMVFASQLGQMPAMTSVELSDEWGQYEIDLRTLVAEPYDLTGLFFGGPGVAGAFEQQLDNVRLRAP